MRIILETKSYIPGWLKSNKMLDGFEQRIDYIDTFKNFDKTRDIYDKLLDKSHVRITASGTFVRQLCNIRNANADQAANFEDFVRSRQAL